MITEGPNILILTKKIEGNISHMVSPGGWSIATVPSGGYELRLQLQALINGPDTIPDVIAQVNNILPLNYCEIQGPGSNSDRILVAAVQAAFPATADVEGRADRDNRFAFSG
jgi:hypothetical protein